MTLYDATAPHWAHHLPRPIPGSCRLGLVKPGTWGLYDDDGQQVKYRTDPARTEAIVRAHMASDHNLRDQALCLDCEFDLFADGIEPDEQEKRIESIIDCLLAVRRAAPWCILTNYEEVGDFDAAMRGEVGVVRSKWTRTRYTYEDGKRSARGIDAETIPGYTPSVSLYTLGDDMESWVMGAHVSIESARQRGRCIAFICPYYHTGLFMPGSIRGKPLPLEFWRLQLAELRAMRYVDPAIWLPGGKTSEEEVSQPWYTVAREMV